MLGFEKTKAAKANKVNTELENYMKVTREDIQRVANEYLTQDARILLYYLPKDSE